MTVIGILKLEIDEQGIEARITIILDENGAEISAETITGVLAEKRVREGVDTEAIDKALRALSRKKRQEVSFIAASGAPPQPAVPEQVEYETLSIPPRLQKIARSLLQGAPPPKVWRTREERVKTEKKVLKKPSLPFLPAKEEVEIVVEKRIVREEATVDAKVEGTGFFPAGAVVARVRPGKPGKEGRSIFGRIVPPPRTGEALLLGEGLARSGSEITAGVSGFLRRGANWCDLVPYADHAVDLARSPDGLTCLLSFALGDASAPLPSVRDILERAEKLGFARQDLLATAEIDSLLRGAIAKKAPLASVSLTRRVDGAAEVAVAPDKLTAMLTLRKGRGGGKPLTLADISAAISKSGVKGYSAEAVRKDILDFFKGPQTDLDGYTLARGQPARPGADGRVQWLVEFLSAEDAQRIRVACSANSARLAGLASLSVFPIARVEAVAIAGPQTPVLRVTAATLGEPGADVFGKAVPGPRAVDPVVRLFEGVALRGDTVFATEPGILEKGSEGMAILLRARRHRDAELRLEISPDRLRALLSFVPSEGTGARVSVAEARAAIENAGVVRGLKEEAVREALDGMTRDAPFTQLLIAEGKAPDKEAGRRVVFQARIATGAALTIREDGRADFREQDRISRVGKGDLIATLRPTGATAADGWDVTGRSIPAATDQEESLEAGAGVTAAEQSDGSVKYFADLDGEIVRDGPVVWVREVHTVYGDVDMGTGNVDFPGTVRVKGTVRSGFRVRAGGDLYVGEAVEAAELSAAGSITIGQGIKGEGKAVLRAKKAIFAAFAEQASLVAIGDIRVRGPCLHCRITCGGKLELATEKGSLIGGTVRASQGISLQNLGAPGGARTDASFGQDYLLSDQIKRSERETAALALKAADLSAEMKRLAKLVEAEHFAQGKSPRPQGPAAARPAAAAEEPAIDLARVRMEKLKTLKQLEQLKLRLIGMRDTFDEHIPSALDVRGTLYPGAMVESHGRRYSVSVEKRLVTLRFDPREGKIVDTR